jgi:hypothetical protein
VVAVEYEAGLIDEDTGALTFQSWRRKTSLSKQESGVQSTTSRQVSYKTWKLEVA